jgi:hypothetical protein
MEGKMAVITSEWAANPLGHQGPESYAPLDRRAPEEPTGGARVAYLHPQTAEHSQPNDRSAENLDVLIQRAAADSMDEIDNVIRDLESMREMLRNRGEQASRYVAGYASLCQASMTAMKIISNHLKVWKDSPDRSSY